MSGPAIPPLDASRGVLPHLAVAAAWPDSPDPRGDRALSLRLMALKRRFRRGWLRVGIPEAHCESVADHVCSMALLCARHAPETLDPGAAVFLCLVHELGEIDVGDCIPADGLSKEVKRAREDAAVQDLLDSFPPTRRQVLEPLWREYNQGHSALARFVKAMDYLDMGLQAMVYMAEGHQGARELWEAARNGLADTPYLGILSL